MSQYQRPGRPPYKAPPVSLVHPWLTQPMPGRLTACAFAAPIIGAFLLLMYVTYSSDGGCSGHHLGCLFQGLFALCLACLAGAISATVALYGRPTPAWPTWVALLVNMPLAVVGLFAGASFLLDTIRRLT